ncbi:M20/M25/M40 family metallo-hydrolase [candidate division KSB1 bacterium]|nr:M20/M25/M40 family metallo-hydrolase [candidate division KSB1 bacterium]
MRKIALLHLSLLFILFPVQLSQFRWLEKSNTKAAENFSCQNIRSHIQFLGHDSLKGRATGSHGEFLAGQYIAKIMKTFNIIPIGDDKTYFQGIPMHGSKPLPESSLQVFTQNEIISLELGKDYLLYKTGAQTFVPSPLELIFIGYGIVAPEYDYNDYQNIDVKDKIVVYLAGEPLSTDSSYFRGDHLTIFSYPETKQRIAVSRGARGSILLPNPRDGTMSDWDQMKREFSFEDVTLAYAVAGHLSLVVSSKVAHLLFKQADYSFTQVHRMETAGSVKSFPLKSSIAFRGKFKNRDFISRNVIGLLPGNDPLLKDTYLLLSAHYDHLGVGPPVQSDSIYNGVIDNASGVAGLLEIMKHLIQTELKRSIIFLFVTGEEKGLLGSQYYIDHPFAPHFKTVVNINIDGLAFLDTFKDVIGIGSKMSTLENDLKTVASDLDFFVSDLPPIFEESESFSKSDQITFARAGIPSVFVVEGFNYSNYSVEQALNKWYFWQTNVYHTPFDDTNQPINFQAAAQLCSLIFDLTVKIANSETVPQWKPGTEYIHARLQSIAEKR